MEIKCQLDATEVFIADNSACSTCFGHHHAHHQELKSIVQWLLPVVFCAVVFKLLIWCGAEGYVSSLQDAAASCKPDTKYHRQQLQPYSKQVESGLSRLSTCILYGCLQRVTMPKAVVIQFVLLRMSSVLLETC